MFATNVVCFMYLGHAFPTTNRRDFGREFTACKFPNPPQIDCTLTPIYAWMCFQWCLLHAQGTCKRLWLLFHWFCSLCVRCVCAWFDLNVCDTLDVSSWHIYFLDRWWVSLQNPLIWCNEVTSRRTCTVLLSSATPETNEWLCACDGDCYRFYRPSSWMMTGHAQTAVKMKVITLGKANVVR